MYLCNSLWFRYLQIGSAQKGEGFAQKGEGFAQKGEGFAQKGEGFAQKGEGLLKKVKVCSKRWRFILSFLPNTVYLVLLNKTQTLLCGRKKSRALSNKA